MSSDSTAILAAVVTTPRFHDQKTEALLHVDMYMYIYIYIFAHMHIKTTHALAPTYRDYAHANSAF